MKPLFRLLLVVLIAMAVMAPAAQGQESQSVPAAAALAALLDQHKLEAVAARDPEQPGRFVAALYFPGLQLLVVSAVYPAPALLEKQISEKKYSDVYLDIQSAAARDGQFFVMDLQADGLRRQCGPEQPFDSTSRNGGTHVSFDGKWEAQTLTEAEYNTRFDEDDDRYTRMLSVLAGSLNGTKTTVGQSGVRDGAARQ